MSLRHRISGRATTTLVVIVAIALGLLSQFQLFGQIVVGLYGITAIVTRMGSRTTIIMSLLSLVVVPVAIVAGRSTVATNFATYTFLLFVVASILIARELAVESKLILEQRRSSRE